MDLAQLICQYCNENNISKEKLATHANLARSTLYRMMEADKTPTLLNLTKLAIAMQVHPQYLIKLEWNKYKLSSYEVTPIHPLDEPMRWFHSQQDNVHFISETVADGSLVCTNERFTKTWRLQNTGETVWHNRKLVCQDCNDKLQNQPILKPFNETHCFKLTPITNKIHIPETRPGQTVDLTAEFIAPSIPAAVFSYWKMVDANGDICFSDCIGVYIAVQVVSAGSATS